MEVRAAEGTEAGAIAAIVQACDGAPRWTIAQVEGVLERAAEGRAGVLVAVESGSLAGVVVVTWNGVAGEPAELEMVGVLPAWRRRGVGRAVCEAAEAWCRKRSVPEMLLEVRSQNVPALGLYYGLGWEEVGRRRGYYRSPEDDALVLRRRLL